jgi:hypothetical protein
MPIKKKKTAKKSKGKISKSAAAKRAKKASARRASHPTGSHPTKTVKKKQSRVAANKKKSSSGTMAPRRPKAARRAGEELDSRWVGGRVASERQSDFEGLSRAEEADSESVDELVEEGNIFEAGAVSGVEAADDQDTKEVRTHEVPEDDVPDEYLDKD